MDIYKQRSVWNLALLFVGLAILLVTSFYANYLAQQLLKSEENNQRIYVAAMKDLAQDQDLNRRVDLQFSIIQDISLPVVALRSDGTYVGNNWGERRDSTTFWENKFNQAIDDGYTPIEGLGNEQIIIFRSPVYNYIRFFPLLQFLMLAVFVGLGYYQFSSTRRAEQNRVWAGMAKETAHQLGTPISAILAWIEFLKESNKDRPEQLEVIEELDKDVDRLELIADRFSKIGSDPRVRVNKHF